MSLSARNLKPLEAIEINTEIKYHTANEQSTAAVIRV
jgi:hypothetical protein